MGDGARGRVGGALQGVRRGEEDHAVRGVAGQMWRLSVGPIVLGHGMDTTPM